MALQLARVIVAGVIVAAFVLGLPAASAQATPKTPSCVSGYYLQAVSAPGTDAIAFEELPPDERDTFLRILNRSTTGQQLGLLADAESNVSRRWAGRVIEHRDTTWEIVGLHVDCLTRTPEPSPSELPKPVTVVSSTPTRLPAPDVDRSPSIRTFGASTPTTSTPGQPGFGGLFAVLAFVIAMLPLRR